MMRTEFIQTKIRPIKKLFILNEKDFISFVEIVRKINREIDIVQNLILLNDSDLWSKINLEFIRRHDPDVIINFSDTDNEELSNYFEIMSVNPNDDKFKIGRFGTSLFSFSTMPLIAEKFQEGIPERVFAQYEINDEPVSLFGALNFGLVENKDDLNLGLSIFKNMEIVYLNGNEDIIKYTFENDKKFINLTNVLGSGVGGGTSIWEIDYNKKNLFDKDKYIFVSSVNDIKTITYFWNTRSTYYYSKLAWIPEDLLCEFKKLIDDSTFFISLSDKYSAKIQNLFPEAKIINPNRYYFRGPWDRWKCFEHNQSINISDSNILIHHPSEKCFSDIGYGSACVFEIRGLDEFVYPVRKCIDDLYIPDHHDKTMFPERFIRISRKGLSKYVLQFEPFDTSGLTVSIKIPAFESVIPKIFESKGYKCKRTTKSSIIEQLVKLLGGTAESELICKKNIFELLISLTPKKRTEKVIEKLFGKKVSGLDSDEIISLVGKVKATGAVDFPIITMSIEQLVGKAEIKSSEKISFFKIIQKLYDKKIFLRGKSFNCLHCSSFVWLPLEEVTRNNYCNECGSEIQIPVYLNNKPETDYYRLNQLVVRAVDQGQMSTLLLLNYFAKQKYRTYNFVTNLEIFSDSNLITDVDVFIRIGKKLGIGECKSNSGFNLDQVDQIIKLAVSLKCDFLLFSCLLEQVSQDICKLEQHINTKIIDIPVFIFTSDELFSETPCRFYEYFELRHDSDFVKGAIVVGRKNEQK